MVALTLNCGCVRFYLDHNAGRDWVPVVIRANLDRLKAAGHHLAFRAIFHMLDLDDDVIGCVPLDGQLCLGRAGQRGMAAWSIAGNAAMVNDDDGAIESVPDGVCGSHVGTHVFVAALRSGK